MGARAGKIARSGGYHMYASNLIDVLLSSSSSKVP